MITRRKLQFRLDVMDMDLSLLEKRVSKLEKTLKEPVKTKTVKVSKATKAKE